MNYRRKIIQVFTFLGGIYFFLEYVLPAEIPLPAVMGGPLKFGKYHQQISDGFIVITSMSIFLGIINLLYIHGMTVVFRRKGTLNSIALLLGLGFMAYVTAQDWMANERASSMIDEYQSLELFAEYIAEKKAAAGQEVPAPNVRLSAFLIEVERIGETTRRRTALPLESRIDPDGLSFHLARTSDNELKNAWSEISALKPELASAANDSLIKEKLGSIRSSLASARAALQILLELEYKESFQRRLYNLLFDGVFVALGSAMFSLLGFYIAAAAYRAFRIRSMESTLMMSAAVLVMLGQIPFGVWIWESLPDVRLWILQVPNSAAFRGVAIGALVAGLIAAFRMWFSVEAESFAERTER